MAEFADELRQLLAGSTQPGPMYEGWQNPLTDPNQKAPNGAYATPFDRQGGPAVAEEETRAQIAAALEHFMGPDYDRSAIDQVLNIIKGTNQSPADRGVGAGTVPPSPASAYGSMLSAPAQTNVQPQAQASVSAPAQFGAPPTGMSQDMWVRFNQLMSADEDRRKKEEEDKKREDDEKRRKEEMSAFMSVIAPSIADVIKSQVAASVDAALVANGLKAPTQMSAPTPQTQQAQQTVGAQNPMAGNSGLAFGGGTQMSTQPGAWQGLPGIQLPGAAGVPANNAAVQVDNDPNQQKAARFAQLVQEKMSTMQPQAASRLSEDARSIFAPIAMGLPVNIDDPLVQSIAKEAGIEFTSSGFGGGM